MLIGVDNSIVGSQFQGFYEFPTYDTFIDYFFKLFLKEIFLSLSETSKDKEVRCSKDDDGDSSDGTSKTLN